MERFIRNRYFTTYFQIIDQARVRSSTSGERHHIIPSCMGGSDDCSNLAVLTAREHFLVHILLTKFTYGSDKSKMSKAVWIMKGKFSSRKFNSRLYQSIRDVSNSLQVQSTTTMWEDPIWRAKMISIKTGRKNSDETKSRMSASAKLRHKEKPLSVASLAKMSESLKKPISESHKASIRLSAHRGSKPKIECPHCHKIGGKPAMIRFHFNNCKAA